MKAGGNQVLIAVHGWYLFDRSKPASFVCAARGSRTG
jgi:hypothetical protein